MTLAHICKSTQSCWQWGTRIFAATRFILYVCIHFARHLLILAMVDTFIDTSYGVISCTDTCMVMYIVTNKPEEVILWGISKQPIHIYFNSFAQLYASSFLLVGYLQDGDELKFLCIKIWICFFEWGSIFKHTVGHNRGNLTLV